MVFWLNAFPVKSGISSMFWPLELLVRWQLDYAKHCRVLPGTYCEARDEPSPSNTMVACTHETIAIGPTCNLQCSVQFYCLNTGRILNHQSLQSFTPYPMPDQIIKRVNCIDVKEKQDCSICFLNQRAEPYEWTDEIPDDNLESQGLLEEEEVPYPDVSAKLPGVEMESEEADFTVICDEPKPDFCDLTTVALDNAGINSDNRLVQQRRMLPMSTWLTTSIRVQLWLMLMTMTLRTKSS